MSNFETMTITQLVDFHNSQKDAVALTGWKGKKTDLIEKIKEVVKKARGSVTIKSVSVELLTATAFQDEQGRNIGYDYDTILAKVLEDFPDASTTVKCLRWYATHLNKDPDIKMPIRPRKKVEKAEVEVEKAEEPEADPIA